ncbi:MAG: RNA-directed DNA polymerase [Campylobacterales bacterium]|nr:RNA-directed DNA polymerase [Campylobacterales bacterium]
MKVDLYSAYKKLKSFVYEDNTLLHLRIALAEFENHDFETKLKNLEIALDNFNKCKSSTKISKYISKIQYIVLPKKISENKQVINSQEPIFYSNNLVREKYSVEDKDFNVFIDCPIELHIISVLWIMYIGEKLDSELDSQVCGYRLARNSDKLFEQDSYRLFEKYHEKYSYFRDSALSKAIELHKLGLDTTVVNLDIKRFFYYIKFDFESLDELAGKYKYLNLIMNSIYRTYQTKLLRDKVLSVKTDRVLPIGLVSSSIVANYALHEFDTFIQNQIKPENYTRYVDDVLLVFSNKNIDSMDTLLGYFICKENTLNFKKKCGFVFFKSNNNQFLLQQNKIKILEFKKDASISLLKKFKKTIESNRSAFNFLPEEKNIFNTLEEVSININYSSTINKISSIEKSSINILSISRNLSQMIRIVLIINHKDSEIEKYNEHLKDIFIGINLLELSKLWEKLFLYLILSRSFQLLKKIVIDILKTIDNLEHHDSELTNKLKSDLLRYLANSLLMSASLDIKVFKNSIQPFLELKTKDFYSSLYELITTKYIDEYSTYMINSNLIRQYFIRYPLLSFSNDEKHSFIDKSLVLKKLKIEIVQQKIKYSPRFIHYHEVLLFEKFTHKKYAVNEVFEKYRSYNNSAPNKSKYPSMDNNLMIVSSTSESKNLKIGMANINVNPQNSFDSMMGNPNLSSKRLNDIYQVLNMAKLTNCDMVIFPEISIPIYWLQEIVEFSKRNEMAIIFGIEHLSYRKNVCNYAVAALPFRDGVYKNVFVDFELKSLYSPEEKKIIEGYGYKVPAEKGKKTKKIYKYKENYFSVFNCYELTDISYRASLVGKVDFVIAIEHNKDTNYFSNIVGSVARDIHAYIIQVNDAKYGDSRITQPAKTEQMDLAKIKGGEDVALLTSTLNVKRLRAFQKKSHILQSEDKSFKQTPPNFFEKSDNGRLDD